MSLTPTGSCENNKLLIFFFCIFLFLCFLWFWIVEVICKGQKDRIQRETHRITTFRHEEGAGNEVWTLVLVETPSFLSPRSAVTPPWTRRSTQWVEGRTGSCLTPSKALILKPSSGQACALWRSEGTRKMMENLSPDQHWDRRRLNGYNRMVSRWEWKASPILALLAFASHRK